MTIETDLMTASKALLAQVDAQAHKTGWPDNTQREALRGAIAAYEKPDNWATGGQIEDARSKWQSDDLEIDDYQVKQSEGEGGTWIAAWVWMPDPSMYED